MSCTPSRTLQHAVMLLTMLLLPATAPAQDAPAPPPGTIRQLMCRGNAGIHVAVDQDPSPRSPRMVLAVMTFGLNSVALGADFAGLEPGACSWNPLGDAGIKPEAGVVRFDLDRTGSQYIPNPSTLAAWLQDPAHRWVFYVDDATNLAISHGAYRDTFEAPAGSASAPTPTASLTRDRLRCRGGAGFDFDRRGPAGTNLVAMRLTYRVARRAAGPYGAGLQAATCAWAEHTGQAAEPGRVDFTIDRPAVDSIQAYLKDEAHFWTFVVILSNPDSAIRHQAWTPEPRPAPVASAPPDTTTGATGGPIGAKPPGGSGTSVNLPGGSGGGEAYPPGGGGSTFDPSQVYDIRNVQVTAGLEGVAIRFEAAANLSPTVTVATSAPTGSSPNYAFGGTPVRLAVSGTPIDAGHWRYSAASPAPLARGSQYWFIADAPASANARHNQATGQFRTLRQRLTLGINQIDIVSDGDSDSPGEFWFTTQECPRAIFSESIAGSASDRVSWSEGRYQVGKEISSVPDRSVPDRIRLFIAGIEDDGWIFSTQGQTTPTEGSFTCMNGGSLEPKSTPRAEWNAAVLDIDLSQYPGTKATQTFIRRSQPLANGSTVAFEIRGYIIVTRE